MDFITIIISTYKGEEGIVECVQSALTQDYKNYEVIVVDDNGRGTKSQIATEQLLNKFQLNSKLDTLFMKRILMVQQQEIQE